MAVSSTNLDTALILRRTKQIELLPKVKVFLDSIARNSIKSKRSYSSGITLFTELSEDKSTKLPRLRL